MRNQLSLFSIVFVILITASLQGKAQLSNTGGQIEPGFGFNPESQRAQLPKPRPFLPTKLPKLNIGPREILRFRVAFEWVNIGSDYQVTLTTENPNPPSCMVVGQRLRNEQVRRSEIEKYVNKISAGKILSLADLKSLKMIMRASLPDVLDMIDQEVQMDVVWKFDVDQFASIFRSPAFESGPINDFSKYVVSGPALSWDNSEGGGAPDYLKVAIDSNFYLSYRMSTLDFCFAESLITVIGKNEHSFSDEEPVLKAKWEKDLLKNFQTGRIVTKQRQSFYPRPL